MKKKLITSALPYVNNVPHLGNIIGSVLSADVYARFCRSMGYETLYICATDEYGTATENKARQENLTPQEICDKYHRIHKDIYDYFKISFDYFGRTSTPEQTETTQEYFLDIFKNGYIVERTEQQSFCNTCDLFLADRYVEGTCPHCKYQDARGDQCDNCGKLLEPTELINPKCTTCGNSPVTKETAHLYIDLEKLQPKLEEYFKTASVDGNWVHNAKSVTQSWLKKGLEARPITRDLKWGIPVPHKGYENKVFYVWFDAPIGYVSQTRRAYPETWEQWWKNPDQVDLYQFMAKDNIPFHTIIFPACQLGTGKKWTMLHHINSTEYLNYENTKFSKSRGIGVFGDNIRESGIDIELWRLYLLLNRPEKADTKFSWHGFFEELNSTFIDNIGNLLNRLWVFTDKYFDGELPAVKLSETLQKVDEEFKADALKGTALYDEVSLRDAAHHALHMGNKGNKLFQENKPWETIKTDRDACAQLLVVIAGLLSDIASLISPIMPKTSDSIFEILGIPPVRLENISERQIYNGIKFGKHRLLFNKLDATHAESLRQKFSGQQHREEAPLDNKEHLFARAALKVGKIVSVQRHPNAERLYIEQIDCGESSPRQIISGIVEHFSIDELTNRHVLVVTGLKPAKIRKEKSEGMLLTFEQNERLELPDLSGYKPGTTIKLRNELSSIEESSAVSIDEFYSLGLCLEDGKVKMEQTNLTVEGEPVTAPTFKEAKVT